jgi:hypothetical protein
LCKPVEMCSSKSLDNLISSDVEDKDRTGAIVERGNKDGKISENLPMDRSKYRRSDT